MECRHVATSLRSLVKTVRPTEELGEEELEEMVGVRLCLFAITLTFQRS
jgi:hypothetical protein